MMGKKLIDKKSRYRNDNIKRKRKKRDKISAPPILVIIVSLVIVTFAIVLTYEWLRDSFLGSSLFTLKEVSIQGNNRISSANILNVSNLNVGDDRLYSVMPHLVEKRIKAMSRYIEQVRVERKFTIRGNGGILNIIVKEREPVALVGIERNADSFVVVDADGFALEEVRTDAYTGPKSSYGDSLPVIVDADARELKLGMQNRLPALNLALDVLENARSVIPELLDEISCIDAGDQDNIVLCLQTNSVSLATGSSPVSEMDIRIAKDRIEVGLSNALPVIMKRMVEAKGTEYIDARFPGAIYCGEKIEKLKNML